ncbi:MAG: chemotaxis response regulator protein-glutamate methylesterase [Candidatus Desulfofervidaceae bacterium]|nr:chemotaxis response regulator protein-glutamate methylesterase [Candidatus Desulfofervidaceae bacterium]
MEKGQDKIKVLVVDDSLLIRRVLCLLLGKDPQIEIVGEAENGKDAVGKTLKLKPDVILMDILMPVMDGLEATQRIMSLCPTPILIVSSVVNKVEVYSSFRALAAGALDVLEKPDSDSEWQRLGGNLIRKIKLFAGVKNLHPIEIKPQVPPPTEVKKSRGRYEVVAIGASTGGPTILKEILAPLPPSFPMPILIVQHIPQGFIDIMIEWLNRNTKLKVKQAKHGEPVRAGIAYVAPAEKHLQVNNCKVLVVNGIIPPVNTHRPSVDLLFRSVAEAYGNKAIGILLTGMGEDGARGLKAIKEKGGYTITQEEKSCVVFGMPKAAIELGAVIKTLKPSQIAQELLVLAGV